MKTIQKLIKPAISIAITLSLFSCGNTETKKEEPVTAEAPAAVEFTPYKVIEIMHTVADFDKWKPAYESHDSVRAAYGLSKLALGRGIDNPNMVFVVNKISDIQKARDFTVLPDLKDAMQKAGVTSKPDFSYYDVMRDDNSDIPQTERIMVTHHVKDFDAWLKVYDAEGKDKRKEQGLIDRVLARNVDDPNIVQLVFAIADMEKAKASIASEEKHKLMTDAGVDGPPQIVYFKLEK